MGRRERPLLPGPLHDFARDLRRLREQAGLTYRELSRKAGYSASALSAAASGDCLPTLDVMRTYVRACGADTAGWEYRWQQLAAELRRTHPGLLPGGGPGPADPHPGPGWPAVSDPLGGRLAPLASGDPAQIGPVTLAARLGEGAMGQVFLGRDAAGEPVAVKLIRAELAADAGFRSRFRRELHALADARSPFIAPVTAADPDGERPWLATPYTPAVTLADAVSATGPLPPAAAGQLAAAVAAALAAIHALGIVHCDLKPSNVLLAADGVRVIDFGIAHIAEGTGLAATGTHAGSAAYMAPEQATGAAAGPAADVFALGSLVVYALTGIPPFGEGRSEAVLYRVVHHPPELAVLDTLTSQDNNLDNLRELIGACLNKNPGGRPAAAAIPGRYPAAAQPPAHGWLPAPAAGLIARRAAEAATAMAALPAPRLPAPPPGSPRPQRRANYRERFGLAPLILTGAILITYAILRLESPAQTLTLPPATASSIPRHIPASRAPAPAPTSPSAAPAGIAKASSGTSPLPSPSAPSQDIPGTPATRPAAGIAVPAAAQQAAPNDTVGCDDHDSIRSTANRQWVSTELGYGVGLTAMLRARAQIIGPWEQYAFCYDYTRGFWYIMSDANNSIVSAELGYTGETTGMLRARAQITGPWEEYNLYCTSSGTLIIQSNANYLWVSAELGYPGGSTGMLRARAQVTGPWEQYSTATKDIGC